ncbi:MAG: prolyl-tRNA synthetase associated domain-containing protein [Cellulosilyticum sp.]|nr:prolyl-tRNA synthetase associated domain-containing protein [Cellulosilyticum sp.]
MYIDSTIYEEAPIGERRLEKEMKCYETLQMLQIPFKRLDHEAISTIAGCQAIEAHLDMPIYKNLFLCNSKKDQYYLLTMPGEKVFKSSLIAQQIGSTRLSFGTPEVLEAYLNLTPGSVSLLGLIYDTAHKVQVLLDEEILQEEAIGCHPCINTTSLKIRREDIIEKFLIYTGHQPIFVHID